MMPVLTLYHRKGCHLCEDMHDVLVSLQQEMHFSLHKVDIDQNAALRDRYHSDVPVLACEDQIVCKHFLDVPALEKVLSHA